MDKFTKFKFSGEIQFNIKPSKCALKVKKQASFLHCTLQDVYLQDTLYTKDTVTQVHQLGGGKRWAK